MDPLTLAAIMGGSGLLKSELIDRPKETRQRKLAAETERYSPWTGLHSKGVEEADPFGNTLQGGVQGYALGQNVQNAAQQSKFVDAQTDYLKAMAGAKQPAATIASPLLQAAPRPYGAWGNIPYTGKQFWEP